jgi:putative DNA primase/helicase
MPLDAKTVKAEAQGKWFGIMRNLGIDVGDGKHGPCPICGPGKNKHRFRYDDKDGNGSWICTQCGAGDGFSLIQKVLGVDFPEALKVVSGQVGHVEKGEYKPEPKASKSYLRKIYTESSPIKTGDTVYKYLQNRGLSIISEKLRFHPRCYEPETRTECSAMLATFMLPDGTAITIHRTFLTYDGRKQNIKSPKKILPALKKMTGGAIRLFDPEDGVIGVAEGIETALAVKELTDIPTWSVVSTSLMEAFEPPVGIKAVFVFSDRDENFAGQKAAYTLANKLIVQNKIEADVRLPSVAGDFLDKLNHEKG